MDYMTPFNHQTWYPYIQATNSGYDPVLVSNSFISNQQHSNLSAGQMTLQNSLAPLYTEYSSQSSASGKEKSSSEDEAATEFTSFIDEDEDRDLSGLDFLQDLDKRVASSEFVQAGSGQMILPHTKGKSLFCSSLEVTVSNSPCHMSPKKVALRRIWMSCELRSFPNGRKIRALAELAEISSKTARKWLTEFARLGLIPLSGQQVEQQVEQPVEQPLQATCVTRHGRPTSPFQPRNIERKYICIDCHHTFKRKDDWIKHTSLNYVQSYWQCLDCEYRCAAKRSDKLKQHFKFKHPHKKLAVNAAIHYRQIGGLFEKQCGFCGHICKSFGDFTGHVSRHFEDSTADPPYDMRIWRDPWTTDEAEHPDHSEDDDDDPDDPDDSNQEDGQDEDGDSQGFDAGDEQTDDNQDSRPSGGSGSDNFSNYPAADGFWDDYTSFDQWVNWRSLQEHKHHRHLASEWAQHNLGGAVSLPTRRSLPSLRQQDTLSSPIVAEIIDPSPQDNSRPLSPTRDNFEQRSPRRSSQRVDDNFSRSFQRLDLRERKAKANDRRRSVDFEPGRIIRRRSSWGEKWGDDWTLADRILMKALQDELEKRVAKGKSGVTVLDKMTAMHPLRRDQINPLLDEKNHAEKDKDAEWVPMLIKTTRQRRNSVLAFDLVIAPSFKPGGSAFRDDLISFVGKRPDLREPIKSKGRGKDQGKYTDNSNGKKRNDYDNNPFGDGGLFKNDGSVPPEDPIGVTSRDSNEIGAPVSLIHSWLAAQDSSEERLRRFRETDNQGQLDSCTVGPQYAEDIDAYNAAYLGEEHGQIPTLFTYTSNQSKPEAAPWNEFAFHSESFQCPPQCMPDLIDLVPMRAKRSQSDAERADSQIIRRLGGQCKKCKDKRKCEISHHLAKFEAPQQGLLLKCKIQKYTNLQCTQVLEHYFHGRTEGKEERVASQAQSLNKELKPKDGKGRLHEGSFAAWVQLHKVPLAEEEEINSNWANWMTLKTHEGVLLELLRLTESNQKGESYYAGLLQQLIPNQDILPTLEPLETPVARICEALSRFRECTPPLRDEAGLWKEEAIKAWIKAWKVENEVGQILDNMTANM